MKEFKNTIQIFKEQAEKGKVHQLSDTPLGLKLETTYEGRTLNLTISSSLSETANAKANLYRWNAGWKASLKVDGVWAYYNHRIEKAKEITPLLDAMKTRERKKTKQKEKQAFNFLTELNQ